MIKGVLLGAFFELSGGGAHPMACTFPAHDRGTKPLEIMVEAHPSLKDLPGLYQVGISLDGSRWLRAKAQPIGSTDGRDVMVRARQGASRFVTLGVDSLGRAALNISLSGEAGGLVPEFTRNGYCTNFERYINRWTRL